MEDEHEEAPPPQPQQKPEVKIPLKKPPEVKFPKRVKSIIIPERVPVFITPDKITCIECPCFPKESPWSRHPKLKECQQSPLTLYEYAAEVVDRMNFPEALHWSEEEVAQWMDEVVGLPEYKETLIANHINGRRLLLLEDMTLPFIGITSLEHMKMIVTQIHKLYSTDFVKFSRSIGLPPRKPLTHCTWFKSRTGPTWGIRQNWSRCDVLRWMKILDPEPVRMNHWDLVWYLKPMFPKTMFARIPPAAPREKIPHYVPTVDICTEYQVPRKFKILSLTHDEEEEQYIWDEPRVATKSRKVQTLSPSQMKASSTTRPRGTSIIEKPPSPKVDLITMKVQKPEKVEASKAKKKKESRLMPKKICLKGLAGKDLLLARRLMPKQKFMRA